MPPRSIASQPLPQVNGCEGAQATARAYFALAASLASTRLTASSADSLS